MWDDFYKVPYVISEKNKDYIKYCSSLELKEERFYDSLDNLGYKRHSIPYNGALPPPLPYSNDTYGSGYGDMNIIFYRNDLYFHKQVQYIFCGSSSYFNKAPDEIDFRNISINEFDKFSSINQIIQIIKNNVLDSTRYTIAISSLSDTITNPIFNNLMDSVRIINPRFYIRRITEEEHHVLDAKTRNVPYDPKNYKCVMNYGWLTFQ